MSDFDNLPKTEFEEKGGIISEIRQALGLGRIEQLFTGLGRAGQALDIDGEKD